MNPLRAALSGITRRRRPKCASAEQHPAHDGCRGIVDLPCPRAESGQPNDWHGPHWTAPGMLCRGVGLGAICAHGEQVLNACDHC